MRCAATTRSSSAAAAPISASETSSRLRSRRARLQPCCRASSSFLAVLLALAAPAWAQVKCGDDLPPIDRDAETPHDRPGLRPRPVGQGGGHSPRRSATTATRSTPPSRRWPATRWTASTTRSRSLSFDANGPRREPILTTRQHAEAHQVRRPRRRRAARRLHPDARPGRRPATSSIPAARRSARSMPRCSTSCRAIRPPRSAASRAAPGCGRATTR